MRIKITSPDNSGPLDLSQFTGNQSNELAGCKFHFNDGIKDADAWFVIEDVLPGDSECVVPGNQVIFLSAEASWRSDKYLTVESRRFFRQFAEVHSCHPVPHKRATLAPPFLPWMVNANHETIFSPHERDIKFFEGLSHFVKDRPLSMFCSNQTWTPSHQLRFRFAEYLKSYFGDDLDWFGNGVNPIDEKWEGLAPYQRTIVLENRSTAGIFTEKIFDPFLTLTQAHYWGAPDISQHLPIGPSLEISPSLFRESAEKIKKALKKDLTSGELEALYSGKAAVLEELHFLKRMAKIASQNTFQNKKASKVSLKARSSFTTGHKRDIFGQNTRVLKSS